MSAATASSSSAAPGADEAAGGLDSRIFPNPSTDQGYPGSSSKASSGPTGSPPAAPAGDEGVEVVFEGTSGKTSVMADQNVFRAPHPVRPRAVRTTGGNNGRPPMVHGSGSYGYGGSHGSHGHDYRGYHHGGPYHVSNSYGPSGSFEDHQAAAAAAAGKYSPHGQYPPHGSSSRRSEDVNVISPNQKDHGAAPPTSSGSAGSSPHHPVTPRSTASVDSGRYGAPPHSSHSTGSYQYPPTSPVRRQPGASNSSSSRRGDPAYPTPERSNGQHPNRPPLVTESSFDSEHYSSHVSYSSHPTTPSGAPHYDSRNGGPPPSSAHSSDPYYGGYGSFEAGSFDAGHYPPPPPHSYYDDRYYGHSPAHPYSGPPPEGHPPYSPAYSSHGYSPAGSHGGYYDGYSPHGPSPQYGGRYGPRSYDEHERYNYAYHHGYPPHQYSPYSPHDSYGHPYGSDPRHHDSRKKDDKSGMLLPAAAAEVDFDVTDPPTEPSLPPSTEPLCDSPADVNSYDVLCGRGGGTNSQIGNRRFRKLVQEFQPIYLLARRKEKPLLARTIVLIIRKRGGRFLKKDDETGELFEVGDLKAEAKTSQALREGLDVRATKSAASSILDKKKKKKQEEEAAAAAGEEGTPPPSGASVKSESESKDTNEKDASVSSSNGRSRSPQVGERRTERPSKTESLTLPNLHGGSLNSKDRSSSPSTSSSGNNPSNAPPSPEQIQFRKRRRMRSTEGVEPLPTTGAVCGGNFNPFSGDKLFPEFCPPRADLHHRAASPLNINDDPMELGTTPIPTNGSKFADDDDDIRYHEPDTPGAASSATATGCAGIALDMMTGAAAGSFCLGPRQWR
eukprot:CAMPEP_0113451492 /NCGR_PEP_ID=MMETSP0014_2-20120614/6365_1 /TAXON_ID=2857 /ORGANISM="Nitzschia sp." /LENGTH=837 /DNA_ID=CAMNT_0000342847 /DNA_START=1116 /DNA_END=3629 /DNA_ORIENTATION=+ /assembly_acc=CAM_ASM_000159